MPARIRTPFTDCRGLALWVYIAVLAGVGLASLLVLLLYQNIIERKAEATQHESAAICSFHSDRRRD
jgi:nitrite reductase (cytochrome c-552)